MKAKFYILSVFTLITVSSFGSKLTEMIQKNTLNGFIMADATYQSQAITAASWSDGEYAWFTKVSGNFYFNAEPEKKSLKLIKNDKGEVTAVEMGKHTYRHDQEGKAEFVRYFTAPESRWLLFFTAKSVIIFENPSSPSILGCLKSKIKEKDSDYLKLFMKETVALQEADLKKYAEKKAEEKRLADLEKEKKFSIKDKTVTKLEIINIKTPEKFGHFTGFTFAIKATLKDGTYLSTDEGGFISDYIITYEGGDYSEGKIQHKIVKDDKIKINVVSKFDANVKATAEVVPLYNQDIKFSYNGTSWSRGAGEGANNFKFEVKQMKHKVKGNEILAIRITNTTTGVVVSEFKMAADMTLYFYCKGGSGGTDNGRGNDGGNGGNIILIKDPSVKSFNFTYENYGGKGGKGSNANYDGRAGRDGTFKEEVKTVNL